MDLEDQGRIKRVLHQYGTENVVAILGANSAEAVELPAMTLMSGDPSYAGPLANVALGIPSFHILEPEIVAQIDPDVFERELALSAMVTNVDELTAPLKAVRGG